MQSKNRRETSQGNAVLFSLIIMSSALVTSLGMASVVTGEIQNVALIAPGERAYYKAESYVEQALLNKRASANYSITSYNDLNDGTKNPGHLEVPCTAEPCFNVPSEPVNELVNGAAATSGLLQDFYASTSPTGGSQQVITRDDVVQLDVDTFNPNIDFANRTATVSLSGMTFKSAVVGKTGLEVSIVAFPGTSPFPGVSGLNCNGVATAYCGANTAAAGQTTPVFVDKKLIRPPSAGGADTDPYLIRIGDSTVKNSLGQSYPPLLNYQYRLRIKALGSDVSFTPTATTSASEALALLTPDFNVLAVAKDGQSTRGIRVVAPATSSALGIFDYVLFSDTTVDKTNAKQPSSLKSRTVEARAYRVPNGANNTTPACPGAGNTSGTSLFDKVPVTLGGSTLFTGSAGSGLVRFVNLSFAATYALNPGAPAGFELCSGGGQSFPPTNPAVDTTQTAQPLIYRPVCGTVNQPIQQLQITGYAPRQQCTTTWEQVGTTTICIPVFDKKTGLQIGSDCSDIPSYDWVTRCVTVQDPIWSWVWVDNYVNKCPDPPT